MTGAPCWRPAPSGLAVAAVVASLGCGSSRTGELAPTTRDSQLVRGALTPRIVMTGALRPGKGADITVPKTNQWQVGIQWLIEDGTKVKAGDRIAELDNSSFTAGLRDKRLQLQEATRSASSAAEVARIALANKEFELAQHRIALERAEIAARIPADISSKRDVQERELALTRVRAQIERATSEVSAERKTMTLDAQVKQLELEKARRGIDDAERSIDALVLKAPIDGVVVVASHPWTGKRLQVNDSIFAGFALATIPDPTARPKVIAALSDVDDGKLAVGDAGSCTLDAFPREPLRCTVEELAPVARSEDRGSLRRSFAVTLSLAAADLERMKAGMAVRVELAGHPVADALLAPRGALVHGGDATKLRLAGGQLTAIKVIDCDAARCAIEGNVAAGQRVEEAW